MPESGTELGRHFPENISVPPQETRELRFGVNVAHMAPEGATQLDLFYGIRAHVEWLLVVDNAGRRWIVHPESGRRARRKGRRWRPKEYMPHDW